MQSGAGRSKVNHTPHYGKKQSDLWLVQSGAGGSSGSNMWITRHTMVRRKSDLWWGPPPISDVSTPIHSNVSNIQCCEHGRNGCTDTDNTVHSRVCPCRHRNIQKLHGHGTVTVIRCRIPCFTVTVPSPKIEVMANVHILKEASA